MRYCPNCRTLTEGEVCPDCQGETRPPEAADRVLLRRDVESNINRLCAGLCEEDIAFWEEGTPMSMTAALTKGFGSQVSVLVSYGDYPAAKAVEDSMAFAPPRPKKSPKKKRPAANSNTTSPAQNQEEEEEISPIKQKLGKLLLVLTILAAAAAVVLCSDWIIGMVKGLFQ